MVARQEFSRLEIGARQRGLVRLEQISVLLQKDDLTPIKEAEFKVEGIWLRFALYFINSDQRLQELRELQNKLKDEDEFTYYRLMGTKEERNSRTSLMHQIQRRVMNQFPRPHH